jgi:hypothetical protein
MAESVLQVIRETTEAHAVLKIRLGIFGAIITEHLRQVQGKCAPWKKPHGELENLQKCFVSCKRKSACQ